jgi:hypothetical protein
MSQNDVTYETGVVDLDPARHALEYDMVYPLLYIARYRLCVRKVLRADLVDQMSTEETSDFDPFDPRLVHKCWLRSRFEGRPRVHLCFMLASADCVEPTTHNADAF